MSTLNEADIRAKLIDPAIHARGWTEDLIKREESAGAVEIVARPAAGHGGVSTTPLRQREPGTQPVAVALLEAKKESLPPGHGLGQAQGYPTQPCADRRWFNRRDRRRSSATRWLV